MARSNLERRNGSLPLIHADHRGSALTEEKNNIKTMYQDQPRSLSSAEGALSEPITISIIYGDAKSRREAAKLCKRLAHNLKADFHFHLKWWQFDSLQDSKAAKAATFATTRADLVIVSTRAGQGLPRKVKAWMEASLSRRKSRDGALVALIRMAKDLRKSVTPVLNMLCGMAKHAKMDYLPEIIYR